MPIRAKLTNAEVLRIRELWDQVDRDGAKLYSAREIAKVYGCAAETIARIGRRETWAWLSEDGAPTPIAPPETLPQTPSEADESLARLMREMEGTPPQGAGK